MRSEQTGCNAPHSFDKRLSNTSFGADSHQRSRCDVGGTTTTADRQARGARARDAGIGSCSSLFHKLPGLINRYLINALLLQTGKGNVRGAQFASSPFSSEQNGMALLPGATRMDGAAFARYDIETRS